jgi:uncharacterized Zn-binding protein involved in type VI secretion
MPPASRISDMHTCPMVNPGPVPHVGGPDISGSPDVIVGYMPQARVGDSLVCVPAIDKISKGSPTVLVNGRQAARIGDPTVHGGVLVAGCPTVLIGESGQGSTLRGAAADGTPFCEECERLKKLAEQAEQVPPPNVPPPNSADIVTTEGKSAFDAIRRAADKFLPPEQEDRDRLLRTIKPLAEQLLQKGKDEQTVANWARGARQAVMDRYELGDHWDLAQHVYSRNQDKFGDKLGPRVEWLLSEKGKTARDIIDAAASGKLGDKLAELEPELIDRVAGKLIENEHVRDLVVSAANGNLKEGLLGAKDKLIDHVAGDLFKNEQIRDVVTAAAKGNLDEAKKLAIGGIAEKLVPNEQVRNVLLAAADGDMAQAKSLALGAITEGIENEHLKTVITAVAEGNLPEKLGEMSQGAVDKVLEGLMDEQTSQFFKPLIDKLKEQIASAVTGAAGGL